MEFEEQDLDWVLVPAGVFVLAAYHAWLLYTIKNKPEDTVIGVNAQNRQIWVSEMMEAVTKDEKLIWPSEEHENMEKGRSSSRDGLKNGVLAVQTMRNNIMASTLLATTAITLSAAIGVLLSGTTASSAARGLVYGDRSRLGSSVKHFTVLICFLVAFVCNVQSIRYYNHVSFFINLRQREGVKPQVPQDLPDNVSRALKRGTYFWSLGLRAFYFSFPLFLWTFGPIPMLLSSCILVVLLYFLDTTYKGRVYTQEGEGVDKAKHGISETS